MKSADIQVALWRELEYSRHHRPVVPNAIVKNWFECDVLSVSGSGYWWEFEIKISKTDFLNDALKTARIGGYGSKPVHKYSAIQEKQGPARFCYVTPEGLLNKDDIPEFAGLWEVDKFKRVREVIKPPTLHMEKLDQKVVDDLYRKMYWRYWKLAEKRLD